MMIYRYSFGSHIISSYVLNLCYKSFYFYSSTLLLRIHAHAQHRTTARRTYDYTSYILKSIEKRFIYACAYA